MYMEDPIWSNGAIKRFLRITRYQNNCLAEVQYHSGYRSG